LSLRPRRTRRVWFPFAGEGEPDVARRHASTCFGHRLLDRGSFAKFGSAASRPSRHPSRSTRCAGRASRANARHAAGGCAYLQLHQPFGGEATIISRRISASGSSRRTRRSISPLIVGCVDVRYRFTSVGSALPERLAPSILHHHRGATPFTIAGRRIAPLLPQHPPQANRGRSRPVKFG